jgi:hypothetical protein
MLVATRRDVIREAVVFFTSSDFVAKVVANSVVKSNRQPDLGKLLVAR